MEVYQVKSGMLGLIVGDALGVPVEFESRQALAHDPVVDMREGGTYAQPRGTWSDDSSMALCLMESLTGGLEYDDQMTRFLRWADEGYMTPYGEVFDMGIATRKALQRFLRKTPALFCGGTAIGDNGNGSLMRILPLAMYLNAKMGPDFPDRPEANDVIHNASGLTHAHPISQIACGLYCGIVGELLCHRCQPHDIQRAIERVKAFYGDPKWSSWLDHFKRVDVPTMEQLFSDDIQSSGYVVSTLEAALWCLLTTGSFRDCLIQAVNLGEDTDTIAAVAGGLAGLKYGLESIPQDWLAVIARREEIEGWCTNFANSLTR